jgi:hypothetical protein
LRTCDFPPNVLLDLAAMRDAIARGREPDGRDAVARGIYVAYEAACGAIGAVRYAIPQPTSSLEKMEGTKLAALAEVDPVRVLYNALVPFALASLESFFCRCFKSYCTMTRRRRQGLDSKTARSIWKT